MRGRRFLILILAIVWASNKSVAQTSNGIENQVLNKPGIYDCGELIPELELLNKAIETISLKLDKLAEAEEKLERNYDLYLKTRNETENVFNYRLKALEDKIETTSSEIIKIMDSKLSATANEIKETVKSGSENFEAVLKAQLDGSIVPLQQKIDSILNYSKQCESKMNETLTNVAQNKTEAASNESTIDTVLQRPQNCTAAVNSSQSDGIYQLFVPEVEPFAAYCMHDVENQNSSSWTVIMRRRNGEVDFFRDWNDYKNGFGDLENDFWLGLERIHVLTNMRNHELLIELEDWEGEKRYAKYCQFRVEDEENGYRLNLGSYSGNAGDSFHNVNYFKFSTRDADNDFYSDKNLALLYKGGWWYNQLYTCHLTGAYNATEYGEGLYWFDFHGYGQLLKYAQMAIRPTFECDLQTSSNEDYF